MNPSPYLFFKTFAFAILLALLAGCAKKDEAPMREGAPVAAVAQSRAANPPRLLAYEHFVNIDAAPNQVAAIHDAGVAACRAATAAGCTLLESRIDSEPEASASLKFRARPDVVPTLLAALGKQAGIAGHSTRVEDLSGPIADTARQLAMLEDYRNRLEALRSRAGNDVDALIKVNRELADVQSRFEAEDGKRAVLARRVDNEILNVSIRSDRHRPFWAPIRRSLAEFGSNLSQGISIAIAGVAYLLPWLVMIAILTWVVRRLWRRRRGRANASGK
jgi:hypothetical protein